MTARPGRVGGDPYAVLAAADPVMAELIERHGKLSPAERRRRRAEAPGGPKPDAFTTLVRAIVGQQLSAKAAATIYGRVLALFDGSRPDPKTLRALSIAQLRAAGLSGRKVEYLRDLAAHVERGELELDRLDSLSDREVIAEIVAVRGFGRWSADMFLIFHLERPDVLPVGDLGIRRAAQLAYGLEQLPTAAELERIAEPWRPHRSLACLYLWESLYTAPLA